MQTGFFVDRKPSGAAPDSAFRIAALDVTVAQSDRRLRATRGGGGAAEGDAPVACSAEEGTMAPAPTIGTIQTTGAYRTRLTPCRT